jgi:hypothetical protein
VAFRIPPKKSLALERHIPLLPRALWSLDRRKLLFHAWIAPVLSHTSALKGKREKKKKKRKKRKKV